MPTYNQLARKKRFRKKRKVLSVRLKGAPQIKGVCSEIRNSVSPKKPHSAKRKVAKVRLFKYRLKKTYLLAAIANGLQHGLQKFSIVLIRGGRCRDLPGVKYKIIKSKYDFQFNRKTDPYRRRRRSKYGIKKRDLKPPRKFNNVE